MSGWSVCAAGGVPARLTSSCPLAGKGASFNGSSFWPTAGKADAQYSLKLPAGFHQAPAVGGGGKGTRAATGPPWEEGTALGDISENGYHLQRVRARRRGQMD